MQVEQGRGDLAIDLDHVEELRDMVAAVAQEHPRLRLDIGRAFAHQRVQHLAQRPDCAAQLHHRAFAARGSG